MFKAKTNFRKTGFVDFSDHVGSLDKKDIEEYYRKIGQKLKQSREEEGYTLAELANDIGLSPAAIANYESGIRQISVHVLVQLSITLKKPLNYFLGPGVDSSFIINNALKSSIEKYSNAVYLKDIFRLSNGDIEWIEEPAPLIPVPSYIAKDHHFALAIYNDKSETDTFYLCKWYKPETIKSFFPGRRKVEALKLEPDSLVIAEIGDTDKRELVSFGSITPSPSFKKESKNDIYDKYMVNVAAVVISRIERLVK